MATSRTLHKRLDQLSNARAAKARCVECLDAMARAARWSQLVAAGHPRAIELMELAYQRREFGEFA